MRSLLTVTWLVGAHLAAAAWCQTGEPYLSPIVFQRFEITNAAPSNAGDLNGGVSIWIMEADGSRLQLLRSDPDRHLDHPSLTADLTSVIYAEFEPDAQGPESKARLLLESIGLKEDGTPERRVLRNLATCSVHSAALSPVTEELTYARYCDQRPSALISEMNYEIRNVSDETPGQMASNGVGFENGVVFQIEAPKENGERRAAIATVRYDESGPALLEQLTDHESLNRRPAVSPDGQWVAWQSNDSEASTDDIFVARIDGSDRKRLTQSEANDGHPWFSRDGEWLVFESDRSDNWEIYKLELASGKVQQLTDDKTLISRRPRF